jgi:hypothetical protein
MLLALNRSSDSGPRWPWCSRAAGARRRNFSSAAGLGGISAAAQAGVTRKGLRELPGAEMNMLRASAGVQL